MIIDIPRLRKTDYTDKSNPYYSSSMIKDRILSARQNQFNRYKTQTHNAQLSINNIKKHISIENESIHFLADLVEKGHLSARSHDHIIKISQTICDLNNESTLTQSHILESLQFRRDLLFKTIDHLQNLQLCYTITTYFK